MFWKLFGDDGADDLTTPPKGEEENRGGGGPASRNSLPTDHSSCVLPFDEWKWEQGKRERPSEEGRLGISWERWKELDGDKGKDNNNNRAKKIGKGSANEEKGGKKESKDSKKDDKSTRKKRGSKKKDNPKMVRERSISFSSLEDFVKFKESQDPAGEVEEVHHKLRGKSSAPPSTAAAAPAFCISSSRFNRPSTVHGIDASEGNEDKNWNSNNSQHKEERDTSSGSKGNCECTVAEGATEANDGREPCANCNSTKKRSPFVHLTSEQSGSRIHRSDDQLPRTRRKRTRTASLPEVEIHLRTQENSSSQSNNKEDEAAKATPTKEADALLFKDELEELIENPLYRSVFRT